jgi:hypothetical protein
VTTSSCKLPLIIDGLKKTLTFLTVFRKTQISDFIKFRPVGAKLFRADGQTDMTKLMVAFRNFANAPNKTEHINKGSMLGTENGTRIGVEKPLCDNRNAVYKGGWITEHIC